jgi:hypothetical protein
VRRTVAWGRASVPWPCAPAVRRSAPRTATPRDEGRGAIDLAAIDLRISPFPQKRTNPSEWILRIGSFPIGSFPIGSFQSLRSFGSFARFGSVEAGQRLLSEILGSTRTAYVLERIPRTTGAREPLRPTELETDRSAQDHGCVTPRGSSLRRSGDGQRQRDAERRRPNVERSAHIHLPSSCRNLARKGPPRRANSCTTGVKLGRCGRGPT